MIPKTHTLTLQKLTVTKGTSGGEIKTYSTIQTVRGSMQPINADEALEWNKETTRVNSKFYVDKSEFTSSENLAELKEMNRFLEYSGTTLVHTLSIIGIGNWSVAGKHYKVMLQEVK